MVAISPRFSVVEMTLQPGAGVPRHDHPEVIFGWYMLAGTVTMVTDDGPLELAARDFLLDPPASSMRSLIEATNRPAS